jgi:hypothetical protein
MARKRRANEKIAIARSNAQLLFPLGRSCSIAHAVCVIGAQLKRGQRRVGCFHRRRDWRVL